MVFAFLFGLSMDYEVFILTWVREEYDRTGNTNEAVVEGLRLAALRGRTAGSPSLHLTAAHRRTPTGTTT
jgi:putative drug exporter of the RND superfamily